MPKELLFLISLAVILISVILVLSQNRTPNLTYVPGRNPEAETAVNQAQHFYNLRKQTGEDFSKGSCLSNALLPGWVADIVHNPRTPVDDLPENQCSGYREGRAKHFVELDLDGNVIRVR